MKKIGLLFIITLCLISCSQDNNVEEEPYAQEVYEKIKIGLNLRSNDIDFYPYEVSRERSALKYNSSELEVFSILDTLVYQPKVIRTNYCGDVLDYNFYENDCNTSYLYEVPRYDVWFDSEEERGVIFSIKDLNGETSDSFIVFDFENRDEIIEYLYLGIGVEFLEDFYLRISSFEDLYLNEEGVTELLNVTEAKEVYVKLEALNY